MSHPFLLAAVLLLITSIASAHPNSGSGEYTMPPAEEVQLKIGDAFLVEREHYRAVTEYKKFLILFPDSDKAAHVWFQIATAYYRGEEYDKSAQAFALVRDRYGQSDLALRARYFEGISRWKLGRLDHAAGIFESLADVSPNSEYAPSALLTLCLVALDRDDGEGGIRAITKFLSRYTGHDQAARAKEILPLLEAYRKPSQKSQLLAGVLSALLPGAGYFYAEHYGDGITAFLINGLFIAGTVTGIHQENYAVAGISGGIGLPFYLGNIYGSANAAKKWNLAAKQELRERIYAILGFDPLLGL